MKDNGKPIADQIEEFNEEHNIITGVDEAFDKFNSMKALSISRGGQLGYPSLYPMIDKYTQGIIEGKVYTIGAYSNIGKSKFSYSYVSDFLRRGKKVIYFSLEVDKGMLMANIFASYYQISFYEVFKESFEPNKSDFKHLTVYDNKIQLEDIIETIKISKPDIAFIDFVQNIQTKGNKEYEKMTKIAVDLQQVAIETGVTLFNLSQVNNDSRFAGSDKVTLKGSGALFASSDIILILNRKDGALYVSLVKNKYGPADKQFITTVDYAIGKFTLLESFQDEVEGPNSL